MLAVLDVVPDTSRVVLEERFGAEFDVVYVSEPTEAARCEVAAEATAMLAGWSPVEASVLAAAKRCGVVQKLGVGVDKIDLVAAREQRIPVLLAAGINAEAVAEMTVLLVLAVARDLTTAVAETRAGGFPKEALRARTFQLLGRTVGLVGFGHIGRAVARRLAPFGVRLLYHDLVRAEQDDERTYGVEYADLDDLAARADVVSLHVPATPRNRHLVDAGFLRRMRRGAVLVNTARGGLVDEDALAASVREGHLLGAGLDVTSTEPLTPDSPLWQLDRVVITPHVSGAVADNFPRVADRAYRNVTAVLGGERPPNPADVAYWPS